ncbi:MAG TPA: hypothetical protein VK175_06150 [Leadbetterella sp.]|nr:hypothetical protein [Leadbetterella sp.]
MARLKPVDMVEGEDGVWRKKEERVRTERDYGHQADAFEYFYSHMYSKFINTKKGGFWTDSHPCP